MFHLLNAAFLLLVKDASGFVVPSTRGGAYRLAVSPLPAKFNTCPDLTFKDDDIVLKKVEIEREWNYKGFQSYDKMGVDLLVPEGKKAKGVVFFMHGFSQYPEAYRKTLKIVSDAADIAVVAVETGLTDRIARDKAGTKGSENAKQYSLQRAVSQDTVQCIRMALDGDECFKPYFDRNVPMAVAGHSMGGGLCFTVAAEFSNIRHLFAMAPVAGVDEFKPSVALQDRTVPDALLMAGGWDLIARASKVQEIAALSNGNARDSALYAKVARGLHTGFQDKIVLFDVRLGNLIGFVALALLGFIEFIILQILYLLRTKTDQLEATGELMSYFFQQMVLRKPVTMEEAMDSVEDVAKEVSFDYPSGTAQKAPGALLI